VRAFLAVSVIRAVCCADQDRGIALGRVIEIETAVRRESFSPFDVSGGDGFRLAGVDFSLRCEAGRTDKERRRRESKKIAELAASYLSFLVTLVRKFSLVRRGSSAHVAFV